MPRVRPPGADQGRPKGSLNKVTYELRDAAQKYTPAALQVLQNIMSNPKNPAAARVQAAAELLNRGHGRPHQTSDVSLNDARGFVVAPAKMESAEWAELLARRQAAAELAAPKPKPQQIAPKPNGNQKPLPN